MSDPSADKATPPNQSGGATINAQTVNITGDVTGRNKTVADPAAAHVEVPAGPFLYGENKARAHIAQPFLIGKLIIPDGRDNDSGFRCAR